MTIKYRWPEDRDRLVLHNVYWILMKAHDDAFTVGRFSTWYGSYFLDRNNNKCEHIISVEEVVNPW